MRRPRLDPPQAPKAGIKVHPRSEQRIAEFAKWGVGGGKGGGYGGGEVGGGEGGGGDKGEMAVR